MIWRRRFALLLLILSIAAPSPASAQPALRVTPFVGVSLFPTDPPERFRIRSEGGDLSVTDGSFRAAPTFGVLNGLHLTPEFEIEVIFAWSPSELRSREGLDGGRVDANHYMYGGSVNYHFSRDRALSPYLSLGVGGQAWDFEVENAEALNELMIQGGLGFNLRMGDYYTVRVDLRDGISRLNSGLDDTAFRNTHHLLLIAGITLIMPSE